MSGTSWGVAGLVGRSVGDSQASSSDDEAGDGKSVSELPDHFRLVLGEYFHFQAGQQEFRGSMKPLSSCRNSCFKSEVTTVADSSALTVPTLEKWCGKCYKRMPAPIQRALLVAAEQFEF